MAIISNFELLLKPIAPPVGSAAEVARTAVQGYFLEISNLECKDIKFFFRTKASVRELPGSSVNTELTASNHLLVYDITLDNNFSGTMLGSSILIPNKQLGHFQGVLYFLQDKPLR